MFCLHVYAVHDNQNSVGSLATGVKVGQWQLPCGAGNTVEEQSLPLFTTELSLRHNRNILKKTTNNNKKPQKSIDRQTDRHASKGWEGNRETVHMAKQIKAHATKTDDLSSSSRTNMAERVESHKLSHDLYTCEHSYTLASIHTIKEWTYISFNIYTIKKIKKISRAQYPWPINQEG